MSFTKRFKKECTVHGQRVSISLVLTPFEATAAVSMNGDVVDRNRIDYINDPEIELRGFLAELDRVAEYVASRYAATLSVMSDRDDYCLLSEE